MLFAMIIRERAFVLYFIMYSFVSLRVVLLFHYRQRFHFSQLIRSNRPSLRVVRFLSLLSLGGLPPFVGFLPK